MAEGQAARRGAVVLLQEVTAKGRTIAEILSDAENPLKELSPQDRARAQRLALDTLRRIDSCDEVIARQAERRPGLFVLNILRLATTELSLRPKDAHGIVSEAVNLARGDDRSAQAAGFVNAVLRKVASSNLRFEPQRLPSWLRQPLVQRFGKAAVRAMEEAHMAGAPIDITPKDPARAAELAERLEGDLLSTGSIRLSAGAQVSALPGFAEGEWWVQDTAAALPAKILDVQPGEKVLDMCAAPGGKTMQMAAAGADVTALDMSAKRMERLAENLARTGLSAQQVVADALAYGVPNQFDAVLLDAPCSATGTIRRHPELPFIKDPADLKAQSRLQAQMIDQAVYVLKPGGRLVFCTCSLLPEEGEEQMASALSRHKNLQRDQKAVAGWPGAWDAKGGGLRLRPDHMAQEGGMDGFFIAAFRKDG
ncbi:RsmB/NOP family class I SAM-dependent RNA methyltransferase [Falsigemmobacter faecalis]|uniref:Methyltransferase domain-containing protein n=1 Tax=Falsigemmobacter faecalis TaxID=2488730 RepID=A0A3P3DWN4_9RHOB|nr:RsmB/NOP family class I SAM-dependent RNA methyltransferase [Falsigemmobacter faecalis]RRH77892.1 methyltransferase domain-containing protein [Falsigemmobacter faecalis]